MNLARSLRVFLALTLLAAWTNALVHPIAHVDEAGQFVHLAGDRDGEQRNDSAPDLLCDAVAAVAACVAGSAGLVFAAPQDTEDFSLRQGEQPRSAPLLAYRSQAPPRHS